jgi:protein-S-isoprenylcysteine O-methyltransferase Ste14
MKIYPPLMVLTGLIVQAAIAYLAPVQPLLAPLWQYIGIALMLLAFIGILILARGFSRHETSILPDGEPSQLMEGGLYKFSRNPIYVAMALLLFGSGLAFGHGLALLVVPVFVLAVQQVWIVKEEENLEAAFGQIYRNYKMRVRRWL